MNKIQKSLSLGFLIILITTSCEFNSEEDLYGAIVDPPTEVSYESDVKPIIQMSCATAACHSPGGFGNGIFDDYEIVKSKVDNGSFRKRVLVDKDMPPDGSLSDDELEILTAWLDNGAPNNQYP